MNNSRNTSITLVGGGPVGAVFALILAKKQIPMVLIEAKSFKQTIDDNRAIVLSYRSQQILLELGLWQTLEPKALPLKAVHISQEKRFGRVLLQADDYQLPALGYVILYTDLMNILWKALLTVPTLTLYQEATAEKITAHAHFSELTFTTAQKNYTLRCPLTVLADSGRIARHVHGFNFHEEDYGHSALVCEVQTEYPHENIAYERFLTKGTLALIPRYEACLVTLIWTSENKIIEDFVKMEDGEFLSVLQNAFGDRLGSFSKVSPKKTFLLKGSRLEHKILPHLVAIGNSAQTLHPVSAQGLNLGLRDATALGGIICDSEQNSIGNWDMLRYYEQQREKDVNWQITFTNFLFHGFSNRLLGVPFLRNLALAGLSFSNRGKRNLVKKLA